MRTEEEVRAHLRLIIEGEGAGVLPTRSPSKRITQGWREALIWILNDKGGE